MNQDKCYMCSEFAVSKEHVPPKCLFPESKDVSGSNYRKELITVPSCDIHNSVKSKDDEFLMVSLAGIFGNNSIGYYHKFGKVDRALKRRSSSLLNAAFKTRKHYVVPGKNNFYEVIWGTPDHDRLGKCFTHIAYGIHYHHFGKRFKGVAKVILGYLHSEDKNHRNFIDFIKHRADIDLRYAPKNGHNQDVFFYQFTEEDEFGLYLLHLRFYGGIDVYISFLPEGFQKPFHLGFELMNAGIETIFMLEGKKYTINIG